MNPGAIGALTGQGPGSRGTLFRAAGIRPRDLPATQARAGKTIRYIEYNSVY